MPESSNTNPFTGSMGWSERFKKRANPDFVKKTPDSEYVNKHLQRAGNTEGDSLSEVEL
jgi:hypothetical protein